MIETLVNNDVPPTDIMELLVYTKTFKVPLATLPSQIKKQLNMEKRKHKFDETHLSLIS